MPDKFYKTDISLKFDIKNELETINASFIKTRKDLYINHNRIKNSLDNSIQGLKNAVNTEKFLKTVDGFSSNIKKSGKKMSIGLEQISNNMQNSSQLMENSKKLMELSIKELTEAEQLLHRAKKKVRSKIAGINPINQDGYSCQRPGKDLVNTLLSFDSGGIVPAKENSRTVTHSSSTLSEQVNPFNPTGHQSGNNFVYSPVLNSAKSKEELLDSLHRSSLDFLAIITKENTQNV